jgi:hypothetical protein
MLNPRTWQAKMLPNVGGRVMLKKKSVSVAEHLSGTTISAEDEADAICMAYYIKSIL